MFTYGGGTYFDSRSTKRVKRKGIFYEYEIQECGGETYFDSRPTKREIGETLIIKIWVLAMSFIYPRNPSDEVKVKGVKI